MQISQSQLAGLSPEQDANVSQQLILSRPSIGKLPHDLFEDTYVTMLDTLRLPTIGNCVIQRFYGKSDYRGIKPTPDLVNELIEPEIRYGIGIFKVSKARPIGINNQLWKVDVWPDKDTDSYLLEEQQRIARGLGCDLGFRLLPTFEFPISSDSTFDVIDGLRNVLNDRNGKHDVKFGPISPTIA